MSTQTQECIDTDTYAEATGSLIRPELYREINRQVVRIDECPNANPTSYIYVLKISCVRIDVFVQETPICTIFVISTWRDIG